MKKIKLYGERNTGTNYLSKLIDLNLKVGQVRGVVPRHTVKRIRLASINKEFIKDCYFKYHFDKSFGWKHAVLGCRDIQFNQSIKNILFVTITKNPYAWLLSLYRHPYHQKLPSQISFEEFLIFRWKLTERDCLKRKMLNPVQLWNEKNRSYIKKNNNNILRLTSEEILFTPEEAILKISKKLRVSFKKENFKNYLVSTKDSSKCYEFYRDYYAHEKWKHDLSSSAIKIINNYLDRDLMRYYGYKIIK